MEETARRVELVPLSLRVTMAADRAAAELLRAQQTGKLEERGKAALERVLEVFEQAERGQNLARKKTMEGYSSHALRAFRLTKRATQQLNKTLPNGAGAISNQIKGIRELIESSSIDKKRAASLSDFLGRFAKACLSLDTGVIEQVKRGQKATTAG
jgi:hypothetical protein